MQIDDLHTDVVHNKTKSNFSSNSSLILYKAISRLD